MGISVVLTISRLSTNNASLDSCNIYVMLAISVPFTSLQVILEMRFANFLWNFNKKGGAQNETRQMNSSTLINVQINSLLQLKVNE